MPITAKTAYITVDEANTYFQGKLEVRSWDRADTSKKQRSLIEATTILDNFHYEGEKLDYTQEHEYPRKYQFTENSTIKYDTDGVPFVMKYATAELAKALLEGFSPDRVMNDLSTVAQGFGSVRVTRDQATTEAWNKLGIPPVVWTFIVPLLRDSKSIRIERV
jgi:hypothetical protein